MVAVLEGVIQVDLGAEVEAEMIMEEEVVHPEEEAAQVLWW